MSHLPLSLMTQSNGVCYFQTVDAVFLFSDYFQIIQVTDTEFDTQKSCLEIEIERKGLHFAFQIKRILNMFYVYWLKCLSTRALTSVILHCILSQSLNNEYTWRCDNTVPSFPVVRFSRRMSESLSLSYASFFSRFPLLLVPFTVPCRIVFTIPEDLEMWSYPLGMVISLLHHGWDFTMHTNCIMDI